MAITTLKCVSRTQGNNHAVKVGEVTIPGYDLAFVEVPVLVDAFHEMVGSLSYDVCEMSMATYFCAREHGVAFTGVPAFLMRGLHHGAIQVLRDGPVRSPKDLEGTRVGVNRGYTVTTSLWARGILADRHGVDLDSITWVRSGAEHVTDFEPPANVVDLAPGATLWELLLAGELSAVTGAAFDDPAVRPLIPDPKAAGLKDLQATGLHPINHLIVVADRVLTAHPNLLEGLLAAFTESRDRYLDELRTGRIIAPTAVDRLNLDILAMGLDPLPYGIEANRQNLETAMKHAVAQQVIKRPLDIDGLFRPATEGSS